MNFAEAGNPPLVHVSSMTDVFAEDIDHIEIIGANARIVYWSWKRSEDGQWQRVALDWAIIRPLRSFRVPVSTWPNVSLVKPPGAELIMAH